MGVLVSFRVYDLLGDLLAGVEGLVVLESIFDGVVIVFVCDDLLIAFVADIGVLIRVEVLLTGI